jgi:hypothetical protein
MPDSAFKTRLKAMTAWDQEPTLSESEIDALLDQFAIADSDGLTSEDEDWVPTYNMRAAAREGWSWKMGRSADQVSTDLDGDRMSANQLFDHCAAMVKKYGGTPTMNVGPGSQHR